MIRNRSTRVLATLGVSVSLALGALAGPAMVLAAPAPLTIGYGADYSLTPTTGVVPDTVAPGSYAAFEVWARNDGSSNISKLFLTGLSVGEFQAVSWTNENTTGTCNEGPEGVSELQCSWLGVGPGASVQITLVLKTPATNASSMAMDFEWSTSGYVQGKGKNNSHGDAFKQMDSVALNGDISRFDGTYVIDANDSVGTSENLNRNNPQFTRVNANAFFVGKGVTAAEVNPTAAELLACQNAAGEACSGQASVLNVASGDPVPGGFSIMIGYDGNKPGIDFIHFFDDGVTFEPISITCNATHSVMPCKTVTTSGGDTFATLWLLENGKVFGH